MIIISIVDFVVNQADCASGNKIWQQNTCLSMKAPTDGVNWFHGRYR